MQKHQSQMGHGQALARYLKGSVSYLIFFLLLACSPALFSQQITELNTGWYCKNIKEVQKAGDQLTLPGGINTTDWMPAVVPGTVLTTLLDNGKVPDPFYGMNNNEIEDIYDAGREHYTYWFYNEFDIEEPKGKAYYHLHFRGVNYSCEIYLNGQKVNPETHYGMFLRQSYNITSIIKAGKNRLAVLVLPPHPVGNPNGGQGGDGVIGKNVMHQYVAGWDWIQPVRDRNTGIWDKVQLERTGPVDIRNPHITTTVPGKRYPGRDQEPALVNISVELKNASGKKVKGVLSYQLDHHQVSQKISLLPFEEKEVSLPALTLENPKLWWPNGYGSQPLYELAVSFRTGKTVSAQEAVRFGIREVNTEWNPFTRSMQAKVNGQKIFIKGGNWIISDAMLRFSPERYDAEIRMHKDMNLNCIRIWGGAITERPEFYAACDKYGILVMQDFWVSGDCNGRWLDPRKKESQWERRKYPDDHQLFLDSAEDQIKMIRNHPSLAFWCGGNELGPPEDILIPLKEMIKKLDGTRWFVDYSTSDSMSFNFIGRNGDGPYSIQPIERFFEEKTFPFNSEVGSVGMPDYEGLLRFMPEEAMALPGQYQAEEEEKQGGWSTIHPVWRYHKYLPYEIRNSGSSSQPQPVDFISKYGAPGDVADYAFKAQLVNYNQYRALIEGFSSHMWEWYTGVLIWKTQNPWTSLRGQMYDCYLDPNAGLYGLNHGSEPLHIFLDPVQKQVMIANNTFEVKNDIMIQVSSYDIEGNKSLSYQEFVSINPSTAKRYGMLGSKLAPLRSKGGGFLLMKLYGQDSTNILSENFYWLPDDTGAFSGLQKLQDVQVEAAAERTNTGEIKLVLKTPSLQNPVAFFNRISVVDKNSGKRVLPVFYSDNYVSITPGAEKTIWIDLQSLSGTEELKVRIQGWNTGIMDVEIR